MERSADRLRHALRAEPESAIESSPESMDPSPFQEQFLAGMDDDLNTPKALAAMFDLSREMNRQRNQGHSIATAQDCLRHLGSILGLTFQEKESAANLDAESYNALLSDLRAKIAETGPAELAELIAGDDESSVDVVSGQHIGQLVTLRGECRNYKQYALADQIRNWLDSQGISVEDSAAGSIWLYGPSA
jgi:cysteinyl-tRNA synthetase